MEKLAQVVKQEATDAEKEPEGFREAFDVASEKWAVHSLRTYEGNLLHRALAISEALSQFTAELLPNGRHKG